MKLIFLILTKIFCANQLDTTQDNFFILTDRPIKGLLKKDGMGSDLLTLEGSSFTLSPNFLWDKYFPKIFKCKLNCENLFKSNTPISLDLVGVDNDNEVLFGFTVSYDLTNMKLFNFVDSNNTVINNAVYIEEDGSKNIFLSREAKNVGNISASYKYIRYTEKVVPLYKEIFGYLFTYIKNVNKLAKKIKVDEEMFQRASTVKQSLIKETITIIKSLARLRMPSYFKLGKLHKKDKFKRAFVDTLKLLIKVVDVYFKIVEDNVLEDKDINKYIRYEIVNNTLSDCDNAYKELFENLEGIVNFVKNAMKQISGNEDLEILSNCNSVETDDFVKKYSSRILKYCTIMQSSDINDVFYHYFHLKTSGIDAKVEALVDFYADRKFACLLSGFVKKYNKGDKNDFLIFSRSEYFMFKLPLQVLNNLKLLKAMNVPPTESEAAKKKLNEFCVQEKKEKYNFLIEEEKSWELLLKKDNSVELKTFANFLN